jgi:hypothetical protein
MRGVKETDRSKDLAIPPSALDALRVRTNFAYYQLNLTDLGELSELDAVSRPPEGSSRAFGEVSISGQHRTHFGVLAYALGAQSSEPPIKTWR